MGVFDKDLVKKDIDFLPDPIENMEFQLRRRFIMLCNYYNKLKVWTPGYHIKEDFAEVLYRINRERPDWWKGDFVYINGYQTDLTENIDDWYGARLIVKYDTYSGQTIEIMFYVPPFGILNDKYEHI